MYKTSFKYLLKIVLAEKFNDEDVVEEYFGRQGHLVNQNNKLTLLKIGCNTNTIRMQRSVVHKRKRKASWHVIENIHLPKHKLI